MHLMARQLLKVEMALTPNILLSAMSAPIPPLRQQAPVQTPSPDLI